MANPENKNDINPDNNNNYAGCSTSSSTSAFADQKVESDESKLI